MKFCSLVLELHLPQNFCHTHTDTQTYRQTDRHFPEIVKSCSGHPKTCKSIENRKSKFARNQYFLLLIQKKVKTHALTEKFNCISKNDIVNQIFSSILKRKSKPKYVRLLLAKICFCY